MLTEWLARYRHDFPVRRKLVYLAALTTAALGLVLLINVGFGLASTARVRAIETEHYPQIKAMWRLTETLPRLQQALQNGVAASDSSSLLAADSLRAVFVATLDSGVPGAHTTDPDHVGLRAQLDAYYDIARPAAARMIGGDGVGAVDEATLGAMAAGYRSLRDSLEADRRRDEAGVQRAVASAGRLQGAAWVASTLVIALAVAGVWWLVGQMASTITTGLAQTVRLAERVREGDTSATEPVRGTDEIAQLLTAMNGAVAYLRDMSDVANAIAAGDLGVQVTARSDRDTFGVAYSEMLRYLSDMARVADAIARGDFDARVAPRSTADSFGTAFVAMRGKLEGLIGELREGAAEALAQRRFLREVVDTIPSFVFAKDRDGRFTLVNRALADAYGTSPDALVGRTDADFNTNAEEVAAFRRADLAVMNSGRDLVVAEEPVTDATGEVRWFRTVKRPLVTGAGPANQLLGVATDITARRRAEAEVRESEGRYRLLVELGPDAIVVQAAGIIRYVNGAALRMLGVANAQDVLGTPFEERLHPDDRLDALAWVSRMGREELASVPKDLRLLPLDGRVVAVQAVGAPVRYLGADATQMILRDVTERQAAERRKSEFVSTVAHEIRTPLTSIRGSLGLIDGGVIGPVPARVAQLVRIAHANTERLVRLVNDVLDLEKMEAGKADLRYGPIEPQLLLEATAQGLLGLSQGRGVRLTTDACAAPAFEGDADRLQQVLTNLAANAIAFSPAGGLVELKASSSAPGAVRFTVIDAGPGIPPHQIPLLFQKFMQLDGSDTRRHGGTGLGLAISRAIVSQHGGIVGVESEPGVRTAFWVDLPIAPCWVSPEPATAA